MRKLDNAIAARIVDTIERDLARHNDPRAFGEAMVGNGPASGAIASALIARSCG